MSPTVHKAAALVNVSERLIADAVKVKAHAPELFAAVKEGAIVVSQAAQLADTEPAYQKAILDKIAEGLPVMEARRRLKQESLKSVPWPEDVYRVFLIDPPWAYGNDLARCMAGATSATDHYPTMSIAELCALPVADLAMDDAVLFLWVPAPLLRESFEVVEAWWFTYKQFIVWDKVEHNFGSYVSSRCELLLICTRGSCTPDADTLIDNVVSISKSSIHSQKPDEFREIIDSMYPHGPRIELFARQRHEGWDAWGNEVETTP